MGYADLFYTSNTSTCYLRTKECGDWEASTHHLYHLYIRGSDDACEDLTVQTNCACRSREARSRQKRWSLLRRKIPSVNVPDFAKTLVSTYSSTTRRLSGERSRLVASA